MAQESYEFGESYEFWKVTFKCPVGGWGSRAAQSSLAPRSVARAARFPDLMSPNASNAVQLLIFTGVLSLISPLHKVRCGAARLPDVPNPHAQGATGKQHGTRTRSL